MGDINDGGPVFPCRIPTGGLHANGEPEPTVPHFGISKRELFAAKAMQGILANSETDGEPTLRALFRDRTLVKDFAELACDLADATLQALAEPRPEPAPRFPEFNVYSADAYQRNALRTLQTRTWFEQLPDAIRTYVTDAVAAIASSESGEDDISF